MRGIGLNRLAGRNWGKTVAATRASNDLHSAQLPGYVAVFAKSRKAGLQRTVILNGRQALKAADHEERGATFGRLLGSHHGVPPAFLSAGH